MITKTEQGLLWFEFEQLRECKKMRHASFSRLGGISVGPYAALNFVSNGGDVQEHVQENLRRAAAVLDADQDMPWIFCRTAHADHLEEISASVQLNSPYVVEHAYDGMITPYKKQVLVISHADCQAAIFYDPKAHVLACIHAGWRGNVLNIYQKTVARLAAYGALPENILVCISPSLGPGAAQFSLRELPASFLDFQVQPGYFDFWGIARWQLLQAGILAHHIEIAHMCTYSNPHHFFSYRREKVCGRQATLAWLI
jgi:YfiH family protein